MQQFYKRTIFLPKAEVCYIKDILTLTYEELCQKYDHPQGVVFYQTVVFTKEISATIRVHLDTKGNPSLDGFIKEICYLTEDVENVPCVEENRDFFGLWKFQYEGNEFVVEMAAEA